MDILYVILIGFILAGFVFALLKDLEFFLGSLVGGLIVYGIILVKFGI